MAIITTTTTIPGSRTLVTANMTEPGGPDVRFDYLRDPAEIYQRSFELVREVTDLTAVTADMEPVALRLIHACGMPDILADLAHSDGAAAAGRQALQEGAEIFVDAEMVVSGITRSRLPGDNAVHCTLNDDAVPELAASRGTTRSAAAVDLWLPRLAGSVVVFGNAPTALFRLLELLAEGAGPPALILGFPVGFVGAAESKDALVEHAGDIPFITLLGRRGGSALAAAAVNALVGDQT
jgi:precorrin-8X/cobalt-precorrin-8 methylmutase